jgi:hypothetical protein
VKEVVEASKPAEEDNNDFEVEDGNKTHMDLSTVLELCYKVEEMVSSKLGIRRGKRAFTWLTRIQGIHLFDSVQTSQGDEVS